MENYSIYFDGKEMRKIPFQPGGVYKVWDGGKYVALITQSQYKLQNSHEHWRRRLADQQQYIRELADRSFTWSGRMQQLLTSALWVLEMIESKVPSPYQQLKKHLDDSMV